jgi:hypothetical protein
MENFMTVEAQEKIEEKPEEVSVEIDETSEKEETRTNVQEEVASSNEPVEQNDELADYSDNVKKRINQLTAKRKQALEEADAAVQYAQQQKAENDKLKQQLQALDKGYINEYSNRVESQEDQVKKLFKEAHEAGDAEKMAEAQNIMARLAVEKERVRVQKARSEQVAQQPEQQAQQQPQPKQLPRVEDLDPKLQRWMKDNKWFGSDMVMTGAAQGLHQQLVGSEGFDPTSEDYYSEIDKRMRDSFPNKFQDKRANVQTVAPASSSGQVKSGRKKTVQLTPGQVAFANKMKIPLERYAKEVAKLENRST